MAAATRKQTTETVEPTDQIQEHAERLLDAGRRAATASIDAYERVWGAVADAQEQAAEQARVDWVATVARTQARYTRETAKVSAELARGFVR